MLIQQTAHVALLHAPYLIPAQVAEEAIRKGETDMVSIGRALLVDPDLPNKLAQGQQEDIRPCVGCTFCLEGYKLISSLLIF